MHILGGHKCCKKINLVKGWKLIQLSRWETATWTRKVLREIESESWILDVFQGRADRFADEGTQGFWLPLQIHPLLLPGDWKSDLRRPHIWNLLSCFGWVQTVKWSERKLEGRRRTRQKYLFSCRLPCQATVWQPPFMTTALAGSGKPFSPLPPSSLG